MNSQRPRFRIWRKHANIGNVQMQTGIQIGMREMRYPTLRGGRLLTVTKAKTCCPGAEELPHGLARGGVAGFAIICCLHQNQHRAVITNIAR